MSDIKERVKELGLELPPAPLPMGAYLPFVRVGNLIFVSGQLPRKGDQILFKGKVPSQISPEKAKDAARLCALNLISVLEMALGENEKLKQVVKLTGYIATEPDFFGQPEIMNGASELMLEIFGERGKHARMTTAVNVLPADATVAVEGIFEVQ